MKDAKSVAGGIVDSVLADAQFDMCVEYVTERIEQDRREVLDEATRRLRLAAVASEAHATADDIGAIPSLREAAVILRRFARQLEQALAPTAVATEDGDGR